MSSSTPGHLLPRDGPAVVGRRPLLCIEERPGAEHRMAKSDAGFLLCETGSSLDGPTFRRICGSNECLRPAGGFAGCV